MRTCTIKRNTFPLMPFFIKNSDEIVKLKVGDIKSINIADNVNELIVYNSFLSGKVTIDQDVIHIKTIVPDYIYIVWLSFSLLFFCLGILEFIPIYIFLIYSMVFATPISLITIFNTNDYFK